MHPMEGVGMARGCTDMCEVLHHLQKGAVEPSSNSSLWGSRLRSVSCTTATTEHMGTFPVLSARWLHISPTSAAVVLFT
jgi:hypothetical protein